MLWLRKRRSAPEQGQHRIAAHDLRFTGKSILVYLHAIRAPRFAQRVHHLFPVLVGPDSGCKMLVPAERFGNRRHETGHFFGKLEGFVRQTGEEISDDIHKTPYVTQRHHGYAIPDERIVGVVPLPGAACSSRCRPGNETG